MAKAAGDAGLTLDGTVKSMLELQQAGGLISSKVLPFFAKRMSDAAKANGGLEKALLSNRVAMNRVAFSFSEAADIIFKSGLSEGLTEFFNTSAKAIRDLSPLWKALGKVFGSVFKVLDRLMKLITPTLVALGEVFDSLSDSLGDFSAALLLTAPALSALFSPAVRTGLLALTSVFGRLLLPVLAVSKAIQEIAFWTEELLNIGGDKIGVLWDPRKGTDQSVLENFFKFANQDIDTIINSKALGGSGISSLVNPGQPLEVKVDINIDGEKLAGSIANTEAMKDAITINSSL